MMGKVLRKATVAVAIAALGTAAQATVLNFDDLNGTNFFVSNYQGFKFGTNNIQTTAWFYTNISTSDYQPHSGATFIATDFQLYPNGGLFDDTQPISNTTPFKFDGAWFTGGEPVRYKLYSNGQLVFTSADSPVLTNTPIFVPSGYTGLVNEVVIVGRQGYYAMDDFTFNSVVVPEPSSYGLMLAGLLAVGAVVRRRAAR